MKMIFALALSALALATPSFADNKKNTPQIQASNSNVQTSIRHLRMKVKHPSGARVDSSNPGAL